jgi:hypothetical protein
MNTITYKSFTENSKHYLDSISDNNVEIIIIKNKKPAFKISTFKTAVSKYSLKNSIIFEKDIISPIEEKWESE